MRIIGIEEHCTTPEINSALRRLPPDQQDDAVTYDQSAERLEQLQDLGEGRLRQMDLIGIDMMVLSVTAPGTQILPPSEAVPLARQANDRVAAAVRAYPDRFAAFATLPTPDPQAAVAELERAVQDLGLCGAMINGRTGDRFLDHPDFRPILAKAAALGVPISLHPQIAPRAVRALYYDGFDEATSISFASSGWGWHADAGIGALRLILSGVFDELPHLQIILGHWGEMVATYLERAKALSRTATYLQRPVTDYFRHNFYVSGSGMYDTPYLQTCVQAMGIDRVMYSTDYPYRYYPDSMARAFLENAPLAYEDKVKVAHVNAQRLLNIS